MKPHLLHNQRAWDERARRNERHTAKVLSKDLLHPLPILDPENWLGGSIRGKSVLCLASGGGLQSALMAAAGARVTVVDISAEMLRRDREVAARDGFPVATVQASMDDLSPLPANQFEVVLQPVSTCYVPDIGAVYAEVARVMREGGVYISQHKQPASLQAETLNNGRGYLVVEPADRNGPLPSVLPCQHREADAVEYLHRWQDILGKMCRAGFVVEDLVEPRSGANILSEPGTFEHRSAFLPPYVKIKARRAGQSAARLVVI